MKKASDIKDLVDSLNIDIDSLQDKVFDAHAATRKTVFDSGIGITKIITMWLRIQKQKRKYKINFK